MDKNRVKGAQDPDNTVLPNEQDPGAGRSVIGESAHDRVIPPPPAPRSTYPPGRCVLRQRFECSTPSPTPDARQGLSARSFWPVKGLGCDRQGFWLRGRLGGRFRDDPRKAPRKTTDRRLFPGRMGRTVLRVRLTKSRSPGRFRRPRWPEGSPRKRKSAKLSILRDKFVQIWQITASFCRE